MDYLKNAERRIINGQEISFIRCDKFGNEIPTEILKKMNFSNSTIDRIVSDVAERMADGSPVAENFFNDGITTE